MTEPSRDAQRVTLAMNLAYWSPATLASILETRTDTVRKWIAGRSRVPPPVLAWLDRVAGFHRDNPPPKAPDAEPPDSAL